MQGNPVGMILISGEQGNEVSHDRRLVVFKELLEGPCVSDADADSMVFGAVLRACSGVLVVLFGLATSIVMAAKMTAARGMTMVTYGQPIRLPDHLSSPALLDEFRSGGLPVAGLPWSVVVGIVVVAAFDFIVEHTVFGRLMIATGGDGTAVRQTGIPENKHKLPMYDISGALPGLAGFVSTSRAWVGALGARIDLELDGRIGGVTNLISALLYPRQIMKGQIVNFAAPLQ